MSASCCKKLDDLGVTNNTIVVYTTDNGAEVMTWPDGGTTPFRGEKATNWEGGFRVPTLHPLARRDQARDGLQRGLLALRPDPDLLRRRRRARRRRQVPQGATRLGDKTFKVHLDGYNLMPFLTGSAKESPRRDFLYWNDDGELVAMRVGGLEGRLQGAGARGHRRLAEGVHQPAGAEALQPARRPVRARRFLDRNTRSGSSTGHSSSCPRRRSSRSGWRASRSSRSARSPRASTSTRSWRSWRQRTEADMDRGHGPTIWRVMPVRRTKRLAQTARDVRKIRNPGEAHMPACGRPSCARCS